ncbi:hypothetical protein [Lysinibacillus sp. Bpr_S20]|uniref:hypothetical protein n=1 Tax=Lysinibacillus sp. Bpr_S20 TaxID=2933964 RepID=UPI0020123CCB|nr:hypothetical protein [Lysinibacillus sp. Bpr_S20]MCL1701637.1 hypothetical protein [Lysinibacillus sp. Bpr_S20]
MKNENEIVESFKNLIGESNFNVLEFFSGAIGDVAPIISNVMTSFKIYRLKNRLEKHESKLKELSEKVVSVDDEKFADLLKKFLFPAILQQLLDEDEDNKTGYFLDGFGNVIDKNIIDQSRILILYDILRNLRFVEIEYLISLSSTYRSYYRTLIFNKNENVENTFDNIQFSSLKIPIESKLESLGLINTGKSISYDEMMRNFNNDLKRQKNSLPRTNRTPVVTITPFGNEFLNMFSLLDKYK